MPARRTRKRSAVARGLRGLSLLAVCGLMIGAVFLLTSNQGCMRIINGQSSGATQVSQSHVTPAPEPPAASVAEKPAEKEPPRTEPTPQEAAPVKDEAAKPSGGTPDESAAPQNTPAAEVRVSRSSADPTKDTRTTSTPYTAKGEISRGSTSSPKIALTFDAGAASQPVDKILKTLSKHGVRCTFFLTGKWIEKNPALCKRIVDEGHEIGNHTYSHPGLTQMSDREIGKEIERTEQLALRITGASTKPLFRFPFGARNKRVLETVAGLGYRSIYWHVDCWDSVKPGITPEQITKRVLNLVGNGSIVLMHCGSQATADALDGLLTQLKSRGYQPVTVGELL